MSQKPHGDIGFTLIEVMIAVVIAGVVLTTVYGALSRTLNSKQIAEQRAALYSSGREAVMRMANEIEGAQHPDYGDRNYFIGESGQAGDPVVEFITVNRGSFGANRARAGRVRVSYFVAPSPTLKGALMLVRQQEWYAAVLAEAEGLPPPLEPEEGEEEGEGGEEAPPERQVLIPLLDCPDPSLETDLPGSCSRVVGLDFRFFDDDTGGFLDKWNSFEDPTFKRLPAAVRIDLALEDERGNVQHFSTVADIPLAYGQTPVPLGSSGEEDDEDNEDNLDDDPGEAGTEGTGQGSPRNPLRGSGRGRGR